MSPKRSPAAFGREGECDRPREPQYSRTAGKSASRPRCSWRTQSRSLVTDHSLPSATDRVLPLHAYTGRVRVAGDGRLTEVAVAPISWLLSAATGSLIESAGLADKGEVR